VTENPGLKLRQDAAKTVGRNLLEELLENGSFNDLRVGELKAIAEFVRRLAFDAIREVDAAENRA
jgi:hypothetical protein